MPVRPPALRAPLANAADECSFGSWGFACPLPTQQFIGQTFTISPPQVTPGARKCSPPDLFAERVEPRLYLREQAHASASKLGLPNPVTVVSLGCTVAFIKAKDRLVIHWDGWLFDARRQR